MVLDDVVAPHLEAAVLDASCAALRAPAREQADPITVYAWHDLVATQLELQAAQAVVADRDGALRACAAVLAAAFDPYLPGTWWGVEVWHHDLPRTARSADGSLPLHLDVNETFSHLPADLWPVWSATLYIGPRDRALQGGTLEVRGHPDTSPLDGPAPRQPGDTWLRVPYRYNRGVGFCPRRAHGVTRLAASDGFRCSVTVNVWTEDLRGVHTAPA